MKTRINPLVPASLILSLWAIWPAVLAEEPAAAPQPPAAAAPGSPDSAAPDSTDAAAAGTEAKAPQEQEEATPTHTEQTVKGAFGISLGEKFDPAMVAKVVNTEDHTYRVHGEITVTGTRYEVEPKAPSEDFQKYEVTTTPDGTVFEIEAEYVDEKKENRCEKTKAMAADFETKYSKPRGKGWGGSWYSFRPPTDLTRSASIYAHRCKAGIYSVAFRDHAARKASAPGAAEPGDSAATEETAAAAEAPEKQETGETGEAAATNEAANGGKATESEQTGESKPATVE